MFGSSVIDTGNIASSFGVEAFPTASGPSDARQWGRRNAEKLRAAVAGGLRFLPRLDAYTEETPEIRDAYRLMRREPVIKSAHNTKVEAVAQLDWRVIPPEDADDRDRLVAKFVGYCLPKIKGGTDAVAKAILRPGLLDGFSVAEPVWKRLARGRWAGKWAWKAVKSKDSNFLSLSQDQFRNVTAVRPTAYGIGEAYRPEDFLIWSYDSLFDSLLGTSDHRAAYGWFWRKDTAVKLWGLHLDKWVSPTMMGTYQTIEQKTALEEMLEQVRSNTWFTIPEGALVEALQIATRGEAEFNDFCDYCDRQMLISIAGAYLQVLEGKVSDGRGDTSIHKEAPALFQWGLARAVQTVANEQMVPQLVEVNFHGAEPPTVALGSISDQELAQSLAVDKGLKDMGFRLSRRKVAEFYGRQEATDSADVLGGEEKPPAAGGGAGAAGPFSETRKYCDEGPNKGKPGPCPKGGPDDEEEDAPLTPEERAKIDGENAADDREFESAAWSKRQASYDAKDEALNTSASVGVHDDPKWQAAHDVYQEATASLFENSDLDTPEGRAAFLKGTQTAAAGMVAAFQGVEAKRRETLGSLGASDADLSALEGTAKKGEMALENAALKAQSTAIALNKLHEKLFPPGTPKDYDPGPEKQDAYDEAQGPAWEALSRVGEVWEKYGEAIDRLHLKIANRLEKENDRKRRADKPPDEPADHAEAARDLDARPTRSTAGASVG